MELVNLAFGCLLLLIIITGFGLGLVDFQKRRVELFNKALASDFNDFIVKLKDSYDMNALFFIQTAAFCMFYAFLYQMLECLKIFIVLMIVLAILFTLMHFGTRFVLRQYLKKPKLAREYYEKIRKGER